MTHEQYVQRLIEISKKKLALLQDMLALTQEQANTINEEGVENLQEFIDAKQVKIDEINKLDEEFSVYFIRFKQQLKVKSLDELKGSNISGTAELQTIVAQIMDIMREISKLEQVNNNNAKKLLESFSVEIKKLNEGKKINNVYNQGASMMPPSYFIDRKK